MPGRFYLEDAGTLIAMEETLYDAEDLLQELLEKHPDFLAGDQMRADSPRRWLLIGREVGIPDAPGGADRWSIDHLFVDQDGTPTLIEVKRSTDTRLRREVIGQMLDYAANIVAHWPPGDFRQLFEARCSKLGLDAGAQIVTLLDDPQADLDVFWESVSRSLAARVLRLVFVADVIPTELQRIIEYLNESMVRTEVLGVEVKQFTGGGRQTLVPRVVGQTSAAADLKRPRPASSGTRYWDDETFFADAAARSANAIAVARALAQLADRLGVQRFFGMGQSDRCTSPARHRMVPGCPLLESLHAAALKFSSARCVMSLPSTTLRCGSSSEIASTPFRECGSAKHRLKMGGTHQSRQISSQVRTRSYWSTPWNGSRSLWHADRAHTNEHPAPQRTRSLGASTQMSVLRSHPDRLHRTRPVLESLREAFRGCAKADTRRCHRRMAAHEHYPIGRR